MKGGGSRENHPKGRTCFQTPKTQAQSAGSANRHSAWGYTSKACGAQAQNPDFP